MTKQPNIHLLEVTGADRFNRDFNRAFFESVIFLEKSAVASLRGYDFGKGFQRTSTSKVAQGAYCGFLRALAQEMPVGASRLSALQSILACRRGLFLA